MGWDACSKTGVDKLRAQGFTGAGIKVGIVDTGIDYKHPALGKCFGESSSIPSSEETRHALLTRYVRLRL